MCLRELNVGSMFPGVNVRFPRLPFFYTLLSHFTSPISPHSLAHSIPTISGLFPFLLQRTSKPSPFIRQRRSPVSNTLCFILAKRVQRSFPSKSNYIDRILSLTTSSLRTKSESGSNSTHDFKLEKKKGEGDILGMGLTARSLNVLEGLMRKSNRSNNGRNET